MREAAVIEPAAQPGAEGIIQEGRLVRKYVPGMKICTSSMRKADRSPQQPCPPPSGDEPVKETTGRNIDQVLDHILGIGMEFEMDPLRQWPGRTELNVRNRMVRMTYPNKARARRDEEVLNTGISPLHQAACRRPGRRAHPKYGRRPHLGQTRGRFEGQRCPAGRCHSSISGSLAVLQ